jgi:hypothetical protein
MTSKTVANIPPSRFFAKAETIFIFIRWGRTISWDDLLGHSPRTVWFP